VRESSEGCWEYRDRKKVGKNTERMKMQREAREDRKVRENKINKDWK
jgi:hypothetical protein